MLSHISLYYHVLSYIFRTSLGPYATEWNGPDFGKQSMSWNGTEHCFMERIIFGAARNSTERFIPFFLYIYIYIYIPQTKASAKVGVLTSFQR